MERRQDLCAAGAARRRRPAKARRMKRTTMTLCPMCVVQRRRCIIAGDGFTIECVATPGHTANHMCFALAQEQALFSGDHVMGWSTSVIAPPDGDMGALYGQPGKADRARTTGFSIPPMARRSPSRDAICAHCSRIAALREAQILAALRAGPHTVPALVDRLYPDIAPPCARAAALQPRRSGRIWRVAGSASARRRDGVRYRNLALKNALQPRDVAAMVVAPVAAFGAHVDARCRWCPAGAPGSRCR